MFAINRMGQTHKDQEYEYDFPTIDFKFQNTGTATAFLWQFAVDVIKAEIDQKPVLDFRISAENNVVLIEVYNRGWGLANNCHFQINGEHLSLCPNLVRQYRGTIESGATQAIFRITFPTLDQLVPIPESFKEKKRKFVFDPQMKKYIWKDVDVLKSGILTIDWRCEDANFTESKGQETLDIPELYEERDNIPPGVFHGPVFSDVTYISMIDPSIVPSEKVYPISRKILPGDVERFHIMIGSLVSCHLLIRFKFYIDQSTIVESEQFSIAIWNPRDSNWHDKYKDGEALNRDLSEMKVQAKKDWVDWYSKKLQEEVEILQRKLQAYPFLEKEALIAAENRTNIVSTVSNTVEAKEKGFTTKIVRCPYCAYEIVPYNEIAANGPTTLMFNEEGVPARLAGAAHEIEVHGINNVHEFAVKGYFRLLGNLWWCRTCPTCRKTYKYRFITGDAVKCDCYWPSFYSNGTPFEQPSEADYIEPG